MSNIFKYYDPLCQYYIIFHVQQSTMLIFIENLHKIHIFIFIFDIIIQKMLTGFLSDIVNCQILSYFFQSSYMTWIKSNIFLIKHDPKLSLKVHSKNLKEKLSNNWK